MILATSSGVPSRCIVEHIPMQRLGTPDEVAKIIYVLCTDTSSYVNGAEIISMAGSMCEDLRVRLF